MIVKKSHEIDENIADLCEQFKEELKSIGDEQKRMDGKDYFCSIDNGYQVTEPVCKKETKGKKKENQMEALQELNDDNSEFSIIELD